MPLTRPTRDDGDHKLESRSMLAPFFVSLLLQTADIEPALRRCNVGGAEGRCGTISVPERDGDSDRRLELFVAVVTATGDDPRPDPIVVLEGGPGASVTHFAPMHVQTFAGALRERDLVLFDQRGTGRSAPLDCDLMQDFRDLPTPESAARCAQQLSATADLAYYTTTEAVEDLVEIIDRLGYERVNLFAISNGTRTALRFLAAHPERARSATLLAPYPTTHNVLLDGGDTLDLSLARLAADCASDETCAGSYPDLGRTVATLPGRFAANEEWPLFSAGLRMMLFFPLQASRVPQLLRAVEHTGRLPARVGPPRDGSSRDDLQASLLADWISQGAFMSLLCSEDAARASVESIRERNTGTFLGPGWAESLMRSCEEWPRKPLPEDFARPVTAEVPTLLLVGGLDPAVQPAWSHEIAETLPRARVVEVPEGQHSFIGMSGVACLLGLMNEFIAGASTETLDPSCVATMRRPAFLPPSP